MNKLASGLIGAVAALGFATSASAAETIKCAYPYWFGFAPVHVATELGFFTEENIEVTTVFDNDRANVMPALETGDLDCTMRTIGEHMSRPLRPDSGLLVIGTIDISVGADGVVAGPEIKSVADLIGKTFAGEINHPGTVMTSYALKQMGKSFKDVNVKLIATDDAAAVFEDPSVAAVATWEPMMSDIVEKTSRTGSHILLSSKDFKGLVTDVIIVRKADYEKRPEAYAAFLRGIYRAVDVYNKEPDKFLAAAAPAFDVTPDAMKADLGGVYYTSYEDAVEYLGTREQPGKLKEIFESLNGINVDLDLMDAPLDYGQQIEPGLIKTLFDGKTR